MLAAPMRNPFYGPLWQNRAFVRVWSATTISIFGSLITRIALPLIAIITLSAGPIEVALLRSMDLLATFLVGLVAGAWVDRLRRRPVLIWSDLGRAVLVGSIPIAYFLGALTLAHLVVVAALVGVLTTVADAADNAYLPSIVKREELLDANSALSASGSVSEFFGFGISGILVELLSGPVTIIVNFVTFLVSGVLVWGIKAEEAPPPPREDREPVLTEIRHGLHLVRTNPILRSFVVAQILLSALWGVFGATWFLFAIEEVGVGAAAIGIVAGVGGASSFMGAVLAGRLTRRFGIGPVAIGAMALAGVGNLFIAIAPAGLPAVAIALFIGQQLIADSAITVYDINETSIRQTLVHDHELGRVTASFLVVSAAAQLVATIAAGILGELIGLRLTMFLAPLGGFLAAIFLFFSPVRSLRDLSLHDPRTPAQVVYDVERDQPVGA
jgi:MFS family permease